MKQASQNREHPRLIPYRCPSCGEEVPHRIVAERRGVQVLACSRCGLASLVPHAARPEESST